MNRPNIVYLHSHDTGRYFAPYGYAVETPNVQRLAEAGVLFRQACCAAPTCSPSRAAMLTGQAAHSAGMIGLAHRGFALHDPKQHLAHVLRDAGYHTALAGFQHVAVKETIEQCGYAEIHNDPERAETIARDFLAGGPPEPFFLDAGFIETHRVGVSFGETDADEERIERESRYMKAPAPLPDLPTVRRDMAAFAAATRRLDQKIGVVMNALENAGLRERTIVVFTPDHGLPFPRMKGTLTDHGIGVALILSGPGNLAGGRTSDALVSHLDVYPTICELAGIDTPEWLHGHSLMPLLRDEVERVRSELFAEVTFHAAYEPMRAVRTERWKFIKRFGNRRRAVLPNTDDSPSKDALLDLGWAERELPDEELYDLVLDPDELDNLAGLPEHTPVLNDLRGRLDRRMRATNDPLLEDPFPVPEGLLLNDPDAISPSDPPKRYTSTSFPR